MSQKFDDRLLKRLDEKFMSGLDNFDIDAVANDMATTDEERDDFRDLVPELITTSLLDFEWVGGTMSSYARMCLLRTAGGRGYLISERDDDGSQPTAAWGRVTDCNSPGSVSAAVKRALLEGGFPLWSLPTIITNKSGLVDRATVADVLLGLCGREGFSQSRFADEVGYSAGEDPKALVTRYMATAYHG